MVSGCQHSSRCNEPQTQVARGTLSRGLSRAAVPYAALREYDLSNPRRNSLTCTSSGWMASSPSEVAPCPSKKADPRQRSGGVTRTDTILRRLSNLPAVERRPHVLGNSGNGSRALSLCQPTAGGGASSDASDPNRSRARLAPGTWQSASPGEWTPQASRKARDSSVDGLFRRDRHTPHCHAGIRISAPHLRSARASPVEAAGCGPCLTSPH